jgi:hypothetical protein
VNSAICDPFSKLDGCATTSLIRTRNDLLELIAHALRVQDQALAVADTILPTIKAAAMDPAAQIMPSARGSGVMAKPQTGPPMAPQPARAHSPMSANSS